MSLAREVICVGTALCCSCDLLPSGLWGCAGNTLLIHWPSPSGSLKWARWRKLVSSQNLPPSHTFSVLERVEDMRENWWRCWQVAWKWGCFQGAWATSDLCFTMCAAKCGTKKDVLKWYWWSPGMPRRSSLGVPAVDCVWALVPGLYLPPY